MSKSSKQLILDHPSLIGVIPPALRFKNDRPENIPFNAKGFFDDLNDFLESFDHVGEYHNPSHFEDVKNRFINDLQNIADFFHTELISKIPLLATAFSLGHDCVHNAYGKRQPTFEMSIKTICEFYGFDSEDPKTQKKVMDAINFGINQDNELTNGERALVSNPDEVIALSEEEMSAIVVDSFAYRNGFDFETRCLLAGMFQATEFKRSMDDGLPGFKWPRTQMELMAKLADLGNFCDEINEWLEISTKVNIEVPWFNGTTALDFIEEELHFINNYLRPVLDPQNLPIVIDANGNSTRAKVPELYLSAVAEKEDHMLKLKAEIEAIILAGNPGTSIPPYSEDLEEFLRIIRPALAKTDPELADPLNPIQLASEDFKQNLLAEKRNVRTGVTRDR